MALVRFNTFFDSPTVAAARRWTPAADLVEADDHFALTLDLPGLSEDDVTIEVADDLLTVSGERKTVNETKRDGYVRVERGYGSFRRTLRLPEGVDAEAVTASFDKGVLEVRVPKPEQRKPRKVQIGVGGEKPAIEGDAK